MFRLDGDTAAMGLLLAPALTATMEAPPIERVHFLRDEMANMVWAIEHRVTSKLGEPWSPDAVAPASRRPRLPLEPTARYTLGTTVPPNWRPFMPAPSPGSTRSIRLQRARLPDQPLEPIGEILEGPAPVLHRRRGGAACGAHGDARLPAGTLDDGTTFLWIGRSSTGRGEGLSGLVFDVIEETPGP